MNESDAEGVGCGVVGLIAAGIIAYFAWSYAHPSPEEAASRRATEQRHREDVELAEWRRTQDLREMRAEKSRAEEPK